MPKPFFIFDFDGTIADTFNIFLSVSNILSKEFHFRKIERHEVETLRHQTSLQILASLKIPLFKTPQIIKRARQELAKQLSSTYPFPGMQEALLELKPLSQDMGIITTNSAQNVKSFLEHHRLTFFNFILTTSRFSQKHEPLKKLRKILPPDQTIIYIGDEIRDIEAAKQAQVTSVAVTWGYNSPQVLRAYEPDYLADSPLELLKICQQLSSSLDIMASEKNK